MSYTIHIVSKPWLSFVLGKFGPGLLLVFEINGLLIHLSVYLCSIYKERYGVEGRAKYVRTRGQWPYRPAAITLEDVFVKPKNEVHIVSTGIQVHNFYKGNAEEVNHDPLTCVLRSR